MCILLKSVDKNIEMDVNFFLLLESFMNNYIYLRVFNEIFHSFFREYYLFVLNASFSENT